VYHVYSSRKGSGGNVDDLNVPAVTEAADDQPLALSDHLRVRWLRVLRDIFRIARFDPVFGNVLDIPGVPDKFHHAALFYYQILVLSISGTNLGGKEEYPELCAG
jgi:hypothetical protein